MTGFGLTPETVQRFAGSLLHFIWQGAAVALAASICLRFLDRRSAELRYTVSVVSLALMLAAPVVTFVFYAETGAVVLRILEFSGKGLAEATPAVAGSQAAGTVAWTQWILCAWSIGVIAFTVRLVMGWCLSFRLVGEATELLPESAVRIFESLKHRMELSRPLRLLIHAEIDTPMVVGCLKPVVLIPLAAVTGLNEEHLKAVLAHELAHIRRHDFVVNLLQRSVESLLFYHPGVWWLSARIRNEREHCCDDIAIGMCGDRGTYIQALVELERKRQTAPALSVAANGGSLIQRVHRLLGLKTSSADWQSGAITVLLVLVWMVAASWYSSARTLQASSVLPASSRAAVVISPAIASLEPAAAAVSAIAAIITASPLETQQPPDVDVARIQGSVEGSVRLSGSLEPLPAVHITLVPFDQLPPNTAALSPGVQLTPALLQLMMTPASRTTPVAETAIPSQPQRSEVATLTDASGLFSFQHVPAGHYAIASFRDGYLNPGGHAGTGSAITAPFYVGPEKPSPTISIVLTKAGTISGRIRNSHGEPAARIRVGAFRYRTDGRPLETVTTKLTDDRGEYRLFPLRPGVYIVGSVAGIVEAGRDSAQKLDGQTFFPNSIDSRTAARVVVKDGEEAGGVNIDLRDFGTGRISGKVLNTVPNSDGSIMTTFSSFYLIPRSEWGSLDGVLSPISNSVPDQTEGKFEFHRVRTGSYDLVAALPESALGRRPEDRRGGVLGRTPVDVVAGDLNGVTLVIHPGVEAKIKITYVGGILPADLKPKARMVFAENSLWLQLLSRIRPARNGWFGPIDLDPLGAATFRDVPEGLYRFEVLNLPPNASIVEIREGGKDSYDSGLRIGAEPPGLIEIVVDLACGRIDGAVVDAVQTKIGVSVVLVPEQPSRRGNPYLYKRTVTDLAGKFAFNDVPPGSYRVFAFEDLDREAPLNAGLVSGLENRGVPVNVDAIGIAAVQVQIIAKSLAQ